MPDSFVNGAAAAEMARIFKPLAGRTLATATLHGRSATVEKANPKRRLMMFAAPALVVIAAAGLSIAYVISESPTERPTAAPSRSQPTPQQHTALPKRISTEVPNSSNQMQALVVPEDASLPDGQAVETPTPPVTSRASVTTPSERATTTPRPNATAKSRVDANPAPSRPSGAVQRVLNRREDFANLPRCTPGSTEDRCIYQDVLNADARLRTAFDNAQRTGVSNAQLATIRARWNAARRDADDDPDGTIWQYNQLARTLDRMARSEGE